ncbi:O-acetyl-ADP-ribose deacetylase MACROD1-like isoform X2 [Sinocyclocheilus anshuiensis]|uniref:O-acetyl-ADP-ribose deacetylase MACROD1-like isoform X2 n=1 Tax=Sinocyclocheilus anshuiensis TaxID=1608454 RepID=UPI0007BA5D8A|nr:PREDICTED: O-acetyl-ADP-ribose deacetylase MACROD1-like isoform X2 [Sinocyclocheilus anshuiensis]
MAFQMSKLAARVSLSRSVGFISSAGNRCPSHLNFISRLAHRSFHSLCGAGRGSASIKVLPSPGVLRKADRWEKVSTASKSLHRQSGGAVKPRRVTRVVIGAVGVSAAVLASLSTSTLHALNLDSESSDWKEAKKKLCSMDKEKRREMYRVDFIPLEKIPVWSPSGDPSCKPRYKVNEELNRKISLFSGDITKLEIDAIANAANKTLLGGGGDVIHTVGPIVHDSVGEREEQALRNCYYTCLHTATKNHLRTVAIPCISTGVYGYPPDQAVEVALRTVREYLEQNHEKLDRVIFCVFLKSDKELYETMLPAYFPRGSPPKSKL